MREIPKKNYFILFIVIVFSLLIAFYFRNWYKAYEDSYLSKSIVGNYLFEINYKELDNYLVENQSAIIYVSKVGNEKIRNFEKKFINAINQNDLKNKILYLDLSNYKGDTNDKYTINDMNITSVPNISVFKNGKLDDIYVIDVDGYNMEKIISYLILKGE
ncbi:MAG: hypothetical protein MRZ37_02420 [Tenericutes bacterium]|nr:hypothetical protein [Mycoplasmatota bacterium]